jgi:hypothetical protein
MSEKQDLIKQLMEMQKKFQDYEHENGVDPSDYYNAPEGHPLHTYSQRYRDIAMKVLELAHEDKGSHA